MFYTRVTRWRRTRRKRTHAHLTAAQTDRRRRYYNVRSRPEESVHMYVIVVHNIIMLCNTCKSFGRRGKKKVPMSRASKETDLFELRGALLCRPHGAPIPRRGDPYI